MVEEGAPILPTHPPHVKRFPGAPHATEARNALTDEPVQQSPVVHFEKPHSCAEIAVVPFQVFEWSHDRRGPLPQKPQAPPIDSRVSFVIVPLQSKSNDPFTGLVK